jgi:vacuolar-type H+-ATPase subunit C/Vma6
MAEGARLDALCRVHALPELAQAVVPGKQFETAAAFQRRAAQDLLHELTGFRTALSGANAQWFDWLLARFQLENLKVLRRACLARLPFEECKQHLIELPKEYAFDAKPLATAQSLQAFAALLPRGAFRQSLRRAALHDGSPPFLCETAWDQAYCQELIARTGRLSGEDKAFITALVQQEADTFHLMLVTRGRFHYELKQEQLLPFHVTGTRIARARLAVMLTDAELRTAMGRVVGLALDELPPERGNGQTWPTLDATSVEALAWKRYMRLANRTFRHGHVGLGAVAGYVGLRRAEVANLITLSEGLRLRVASDVLRARMIPRAELEESHV